MRTFFSLSVLSLFLSTASSAPLSQLSTNDDFPIANPGPIPFPVIDEASIHAPRFDPSKLPAFASQQKNPAVVAAFERLKNGATPRLGRREVQTADIKDKRQDMHLPPTPVDTPVDRTADLAEESHRAISNPLVASSKNPGMIAAYGRFRSDHRKRNLEDDVPEAPSTSAASNQISPAEATPAEPTNGASDDSEYSNPMAASLWNPAMKYTYGRYRSGHRKRNPQDDVPEAPSPVVAPEQAPPVETPTLNAANTDDSDKYLSNPMVASLRSKAMKVAYGHYRSNNRKRSV